MGKKGKFPGQYPAGISRPKQPSIGAVPALSTQNFRLSWQVSKMDWDGPFGWHKLDGKTAYEILKGKFNSFESMTWGTVLGHHNHAIKIDSLCPDAIKRFRELKLDEFTDELISLRLCSSERIWGIRKDGVLLLLWWDPDHKVCPSTKWKK